MIFKCYKKLDNTSLAVAIFLLALLSFASMEATAKYLSVTYPVLQVVWARYIFHYLAFLIFYIFFFSMLKSEKIFITRSIKLHLARSCSLFLMTLCLFLFMGQASSKYIKKSSNNENGRYQIFQTIIDNKMGNTLLEELGLDKIASSYMILETVFDTQNNKVISRKAIPLAKYF